MYTPYKTKERKKLCPRDGTPLIEMTKDGKPAYYYCPICHYTKFLGPEEKKTEIKISEKPVEDKEEKELKVVIYQIRENPVRVDALDPNSVSIVIDKENDFLWIWKGSNSKPSDLYEAGVQATKLKSAEKMYKAMVRRIEENREPGDFLILEIPVREAKEIKEEPIKKEVSEVKEEDKPKSEDKIEDKEETKKEEIKKEDTNEVEENTKEEQDTEESKSDENNKDVQENGEVW
ncbi:MAG: hypothetical protein ACTSPY_07575 [Candidatus Helarchaeota archaeon]